MFSRIALAREFDVSSPFSLWQMIRKNYPECYRMLRLFDFTLYNTLLLRKNWSFLVTDCMNQSLESHISHSGGPLSGANTSEVEEEGFDKELIRRRKHVIRSSWQAIRFGLNVEATKVFYDRLFDQFPMVRSMFRDDMQVQYNKLYQAVAMAVNSLDDMDSFLPTLRKLGIAHSSYGVVRAHYEAVTECFVWTLISYILVQMPNNNAINWMFEVSDAWEWILNTIGGVMADAADEAREKLRTNRILKTHDVGEKVLASTGNAS